MQSPDNGPLLRRIVCKPVSCARWYASRETAQIRLQERGDSAASHVPAECWLCKRWVPGLPQRHSSPAPAGWCAMALMGGGYPLLTGAGKTVRQGIACLWGGGGYEWATGVSLTDRGTGRAGRHARGGDCRLAWRLLVSHRTEGWGGVGGVCGVCVCVCVCVWVGGGGGGWGRSTGKAGPGRKESRAEEGIRHTRVEKVRGERASVCQGRVVAAWVQKRA